jgi:hypothetical protein
MATEGWMSASVAPREVLARLPRGVAKPQVKLLIVVSDPYRLPDRVDRPCLSPKVACRTVDIAHNVTVVATRMASVVGAHPTAREIVAA